MTTDRPTTAAGLALRDDWPDLHPDPEIAKEVLRDAIEAIEAEASAHGDAQASLARLDAIELRAALEMLIRTGRRIPTAGVDDPTARDFILGIRKVEATFFDHEEVA